MELLCAIRQHYDVFSQDHWTARGLLVTSAMHWPRSELEWHASFNPVGPGREAEAFAIGPTEVRLAGKAGSDRNLRQLHIRLGDQTSGSVEPHVAVIQYGAFPDKLSEESIKLALRHPKARTDLRYRQGVFDILFHQFDCPPDDTRCGAAQRFDRARVL